MWLSECEQEDAILAIFALCDYFKFFFKKKSKKHGTLQVSES